MRYTVLFIPFVFIALYTFAIPETEPAVEFLNSLDEDQLETAQLEFDDLTRHTWHFLPPVMWARPGISLKDLNDEQEEKLFHLLSAYLSESGYEKTRSIIELESLLADIENNPEFRDPELYYATFYGDPADDSLWAWSFEGHHISLNFTVVNDQVSMVPRFLGARPAVIQEGPEKGKQTALHAEQNYGLELIRSMSEDQREKSIFQEASFWDIVTSTSTEVGPLEPVGIRMGELSTEQKSILLDLINEYLSVMPHKLADERFQKLKGEDMNEIRFGWAGETERDQPHYYRVQGKTFLIEFDNTQDNANHIHTVWRDFKGDFGRDLIREHYEHSDHHN